MRKKLFLYFAVSIILSVILSITAVSLQTQRFYKKDVAATLINIAGAIDKQISASSDADFIELAKYYAGIYSNGSLKVRITFIDFAGNVLGESDYAIAEMGSHLDREEIRQAIENGTGTSVRYSTTAKKEFIYAAAKSVPKNVIVRVAIPLNNISQINKTLVNFTFLLAAAVILISLILAFTLSVNLMKPIEVFTKTSLDIYKGDLDRKVELVSTDKEIRTLVFIFNSMTEKLSSSINHFKEENIIISSIINSMVDGLLCVDGKKKVVYINNRMRQYFGLDMNRSYNDRDLIDVIRNKKINEIIGNSLNKGNYISDELKMPGEKADTVYRIYTAPVRTDDLTLPGILLFMQDISEKRKLELIRSEFVSNVTHELKTPLTSIRGFIDTLMNGAINDKETSLKFLNIIDMESERLSLLISDILSLSEIEHGYSTISNREYNIHLIIDKIFDMQKNGAEKRGITLINDTDPSEMMTTDEAKFTQLLSNLISNGIKYNIDNGYVKVRSARSKGLLEISVEDNGIGIGEEYLDRIFERFYRVDKGRSKEEGSTGLGLSIAKHLAKILNGDIKVSSELEKGSVFTVTFVQ
jgi:two-component system, OmpR family, phosphate regulon sensor histidine kinase PhoR